MAVYNNCIYCTNIFQVWCSHLLYASARSRL